MGDKCIPVKRTNDHQVPEEENHVQTCDWKAHGPHHAEALQIGLTKKGDSVDKNYKQHARNAIHYLQVSPFEYQSDQYQALNSAIIASKYTDHRQIHQIMCLWVSTENNFIPDNF